MNANAKQRPVPSYAVGYGRPPVQSQFRKGQSGNPRGRPPGRTRDIPFVRLDEAFAKALHEPLSMTLDGRRVTTTRGEGIVYRVVTDALRGDHRAIRRVLEWMERLGTASQDGQGTKASPNPSQVTDEERAKALAALLAKVQARKESEMLEAANPKSSIEAA